MKTFTPPIVVALVLTACGPAGPDGESRGADAGSGSTEQQPDGPARPDETARIGDWGVDASEISDSVAPGDDFFAFVDAGWLDRAEIPAGFSHFGAFTELSLEAEERVAGNIADAVEADAEPGDPRQQIGALHAAYMDTDRIDALGLDPIREALDQLIALDSHEEAARWMMRQGTSLLRGLERSGPAGGGLKKPYNPPTTIMGSNYFEQ